MPSAKKRAAKQAVREVESDDDRGEGFLSLDAEEAQPLARRQVAATAPKHKQQASEQQGSRVMYIGNLPHGFYERQLLGFFSQFGKVTKVRLSRNKKSGKAKHYAFLEFQHPEVCKIATEAMDGYFLFKQKLSCSVVPPDKIHPHLFVGANKKFKAIPWRKIERQRHDRERSWDEHVKRVAKIVKKDKQRQQKILAAGIEYEYPALQELPVQPKRIVFSAE